MSWLVSQKSQPCNGWGIGLSIGSAKLSVKPFPFSLQNPQLVTIWTCPIVQLARQNNVSCVNVMVEKKNMEIYFTAAMSKPILDDLGIGWSPPPLH